MKYLILLLLLSLAITQTPNCNVKDGKAFEKVFITLNESQLHNFADYFTGFNLQYTATGDNNFYNIIPHFMQLDYQNITNITSNYTLLDFDIQTDENLAWQNRAASLGYDATDNSYYIRYGTINDKMNVVITNTSKIVTSGIDRCFDVVTATNRIVILDCQSSTSQSDVLFVFDQYNQSLTPVAFNQNIMTTKQRKTIAYRLTGNRTYLISAWIGKGLDRRNTSFMKIYYLDTTNVPDPNSTILVDAKALGVTDLDITDITLDAMENVYVADSRGTLIQFRFDGTKIIRGSKWQFNTTLYKVSVHTTPGLVTIVQVIGDNYIHQVDLESQVRQFRYQLPNNISTLDKIIDFQSNNQLLVVQTQYNYYVYDRYTTQINNMLAAIPTNNSRFALSPRSPRIIILGLKESRALVSSDGFLIAQNPSGDNQTINVTATSQSIDGKTSTSCSAVFQINNVENISKIYVKRGFDNNTIMEADGTSVQYNLDDYYLGSSLNYSVQTLNYSVQSSPGLQLSIQNINQIKIDTDSGALDVDWFATYSFNSTSYYKLAIKDGQMYLQTCTNLQSIKCSTNTKKTFIQSIANYTFFKTTFDLKQQTSIMAYVIESNPHLVNMIKLPSGEMLNPVNVDTPYNISDIDANERFVYVTVKNAHQIYVFQNDLGNYTISVIIDSSKMPNEHTNFYPRETILSPTDINTLVILTYNSMILMKIAANNNTYFISEILFSDTFNVITESKVVVARDSLLLFVSMSGGGNLMYEYGIYDIYNPKLMKIFNLMQPLQFYSPFDVSVVGTGELVSIKTTNFNSNAIYLTLIKPGQPLAGKILQNWQINLKSKQLPFYSLVGFSEYVVLEQNFKSVALRSEINSDQLTRFYYRPSLIVKATVDDTVFNQNFMFNITVSSPNDSKTEINNITFYNIRSKIQTSSKNPDKINFPNNANSEEIEVNIPADKEFTGPIAKYQIQCPYCGNQIKIKDHVTLLNTSSKVKNVRAFYYFQSQNRLWSLTDSSIQITDGELNSISSINFTFNMTPITANTWAVDNNSNIRILITANSTDIFQYFVTVIPSNNKESANIQPPISISGAIAPVISNANLMKILKNRVFILGKRNESAESSAVFIYTITNSTGTETMRYDTSFGNFGVSVQGINDFELVPIQGRSVDFFLATLGKFGFAFFTFDSGDGAFNYTTPKTTNLNTISSMTSYIANSRFLQLQIYSSTTNTQSIQLGVYMTVDNGQHQQFTLSFKGSDDEFDYESLQHINSFGKYGNLQVVNWAQKAPYSNTADNFLLIAHQGSGTTGGNKLSLGLFNLDVQSSSQAQQMTGAVERSISKSLSNNFAALMYRDGDDLKVVQSISNDGETGAQVYSLSANVSIVYKYDQAGDFKQIQLIASNQYGSASKTIPVQFDQPASKGLAWYIILIIALGSLLVVGLIIFAAVKYRKSKASKESLLSTSKTGSEEQI